MSDSISLGLEVILTIDANEHVVKGKIAKQLKNLGLVEAFCAKFNPRGGPASCFRGRHQIDGVWHASKIVPTVVTICPYDFGIGDHRSYVVDFQMNSILGELSVQSRVMKKRHITCSFPTIVQRCLKRAEVQFQLHIMPLKIQQLK